MGERSRPRALGWQLSRRRAAPPAREALTPGAPFCTTVDYRGHAEWAARSTQITPTLGRDHTTADEVVHFARVVRSLRRGGAHILDSTSGRFHPDLLALALSSMLPQPEPVRVVLMGAMWEPDSGLRGAIQRFVVGRADRRIARYALQSTEELGTFAATWRVGQRKLRVVPYFFTIKPSDLPRDDGRAPGPAYVFSGGDSHRAYAPLVEAARDLPHVRFVLATRLLDATPGLPPNVTARALSHEEFMEALVGSTVVVVPLVPGLRRAAGQQTYLNAMWLGKPTVVTEAPAVRDHIQDRDTALVVPATREALRASVEWALADGGAQEMARRGEQDVRKRFTFEGHAEAVLDVLDDALRD